MPRLNNNVLLAALMLLCSPVCLAERADQNQTIHLEADKVVVDDANQISTFTGNVELSQGTLLIRGDKIVVEQSKDGFKHATAYGNSAQFRQKREGLDEYVEGYGGRIEYDTRSETLDLYDKARLKRELDEVSGEHINYNAKTEVFKVGGGETHSGSAPPPRVRAVLQPKSKEAGAPSAPDKPPAMPDKSLTPTK